MTIKFETKYLKRYVYYWFLESDCRVNTCQNRPIQKPNICVHIFCIFRKKISYAECRKLTFISQKVKSNTN